MLQPSKDCAQISCTLVVMFTLAMSRGPVQVLHADIKPANIFLDKSQTVAKIADYGLSKCLEKNISTHTFRGVLPCTPLPFALREWPVHVGHGMDIFCGKVLCVWSSCH